MQSKFVRADRVIVLNAFRHQRSFHLDPQPLVMPRLFVLNAFRHQRSFHPRRAGRASDAVRVLNAFRHQRSFHENRPAPYRRRLAVLNAFRHQRSFHTRCPPLASRCAVCSTPFGIKGVSTAGLDIWRPLAPNGAQRLSASKEFPRPQKPSPGKTWAVLNAFRHQRSFHIQFGRGHGQGVTVLNAFRHQRSFHHSRQRDCGRGLLRAQRISASKEFPREPSPALSNAYISAQRLSASKEFPQTPSPAHTPSIIGAQRLSASKEFPRCDPRELSRPAAVLNAFRHQRSFHRHCFSRAVPGLRCSTPFGIKGVSTGRRQWFRARAFMVLNAFRHQRSFHSTTVVDPANDPRSAQRLSASKEFPHRHYRLDLRSTVCSTPFGIKGVSTLRV